MSAARSVSCCPPSIHVVTDASQESCPKGPGLEGPAQFDVTAGVEDGSELEVPTGPGTFAAPSPKFGSQAAPDRRVPHTPNGHLR
jgi:hypothetical protein